MRHRSRYIYVLTFKHLAQLFKTNKVKVSKATKAKGETSKAKVEASKVKVSIGVTTSVEARASKPKVETSKERRTEQEKEQQIEELVDNSNNLKHKKGDRCKRQNMDQPKDTLETAIEEMWQLMTKQFKWRKMEAAGSKINQKLNLSDKKKKMEQKIAEAQQQQGNKACGQLQNKVWDPGRLIPENT